MKTNCFVRTLCLTVLLCAAWTNAMCQQAYRFTVTRTGTDATAASSASIAVSSLYGQSTDGMSATVTAASGSNTTYVAHNADKGVALSTNLTNGTAAVYTLSLHGLPAGMVVRKVGLGTNAMALGANGTQTDGTSRTRNVTIAAGSTALVGPVSTELNTYSSYTTVDGIVHFVSKNTGNSYPYVTNIYTVASPYTLPGGDLTLTITLSASGSGIVPAIRDLTLYDEPDYSTNFDGNLMTRTAGERRTNSVSLTVNDDAPQTISVGQTYNPKGVIVSDLTWGNRFVCYVGDKLTPSVDFYASGGAMHTYVYLDEDRNGFSTNASTDIVGGVLQTGPGIDLRSYSRYNVNKNSLGDDVAEGNAVAPYFTAPTTPGRYRVRFMKEWNSVDPKGRTDSDSPAVNGGSIVDVMLEVREQTTTPVTVTLDGLTTGWYRIKNLVGRMDASGQDKFLRTLELADAIDNSGTTYDVVATDDPDALNALFYVERSGNNCTVTLPTGYKVGTGGSRTPATANNIALTAPDDDKTRIRLYNGSGGNYWDMFTGSNTRGMVALGASSSSGNCRFEFQDMTGALRGYDAYTVVCASNVPADHQLTYGKEGYTGIRTVVNGGTFFVPKGETLLATDLTGSNSAGLRTAMTVNAEAKTVNVALDVHDVTLTFKHGDNTVTPPFNALNGGSYADYLSRSKVLSCVTDIYVENYGITGGNVDGTECDSKEALLEALHVLAVDAAATVYLTPNYAIPFAPDTRATSSRHPTSVTLKNAGGEVISTIAWATADNFPVFIDKTETEIVTVEAGSQMKAEVSNTKTWMNAYVYIDFGRDGVFSYGQDATTHGRDVNTDIVAWSNLGQYDSDGTRLSSSNTFVMPIFTVPSEPGDYRMRVKVDWDCIAAGGSFSNSEAGSRMPGLGGGVMDFTLRVLPVVTKYTLTFENAAGTAISASDVKIFTTDDIISNDNGQVSAMAQNLTLVDSYWRAWEVLSFRVAGQTYDTWEDLTQAVTASSDVAVVLGTRKAPVAGAKYYAMRHVQVDEGTIGEERYMHVNNGELNANVVQSPATTHSANHLFRFEDAGNGKYFILNAGQGVYVNRAGAVGTNANITTSANATVGANAYWVTNGIRAGHPEVFALADASQVANPITGVASQYYVHTNGSNSVVRWSSARNAENNSHWYLEEVSVPVVTISFQKDGADYTTGFQAFNSDQSLIPQNKILAWTTNLFVPGCDVVGGTIGGVTYKTADDFFAALNALEADATAVVKLTQSAMASNSYGESWFTIRNNNLGTYASTFDDGGTTRLKPQAYSSDNADIFKWCMVQVEGGFHIYNKAVGSGKVVTLDGNAGDGTAISMQPLTDTNPERQLWTIVHDGNGTVGIVPANHKSRGWNPYAADTNPLKLYDVTGIKSRWIIVVMGKSIYSDRDGNALEEGAKYTFISAYDGFYNSQKVYKAIYLNGTVPGWKTYDPSDDTFYFRAHVAANGSVTMECVGDPGKYLTGASTAVAEEGNPFTVANLGGGACNIRVNGGAPFHANNHGSGSGGGSNVVNFNGGLGSASAWYIQRADVRAVEVERYNKELTDRQAAIDEAVRQGKRDALKTAIDDLSVGTGIGQTTQEAIDEATAVWNDNTKTGAEYDAARQALLNSVNPPQTGTCYRLKTAFEWNDSQPRVIAVGQGNVLKWKRVKQSLFQIWQVAAVNDNDHSQVALLNMGSGTYMKATGHESGTTTNTDPSYVVLLRNSGGTYYIKSLTASGGNTRFHAGDHGNGANAEGRIMLWDDENDHNTWLMEEVSDVDMSALLYAEDDRQHMRDSLLTHVNEVRKVTTTTNAIGYFATLVEPVATAQAVYDDETHTTQEYADAITALLQARAAAVPVQPVEGQTYALIKSDGTLSMHLIDGEEGEDVYSRLAFPLFDDTEDTQLWTIVHTADSTYTFTCQGVSVPLPLSLAGGDKYTIDGLSDFYGTFIIRPCSVSVDHNYLPTGTYRIVNTTANKALSNDGLLVARAALANIDETCTDHLQLWRVEKLPGADRYTMRNIETTRHLGQSTIEVGALVDTKPLASTFRLVAGDNEGEYHIYTTEATGEQLCIVADGNQPKFKAANAGSALWTFAPASPAEKPVVSYPAVRIRNHKNFGRDGATEYHYMSAVEMNVQHKTIDVAANDEKDMWVLVPHDFAKDDGTTETRYALRNAFSGLYMQNVTTNDQKVTAGTTPVYYVKTTGTVDANAVEFKSPTAAQKLNASGQNEYIIGWNGADDPNSHWYVEDVVIGGEPKMLTEDELMAKADAYEGFCAPRDGLICRIYNPSRGTYLDENYNAHGPRHNGLNTAKNTQLWRLHYDAAEAMYSIENLYTGHYLLNQPSQNGQYYMTDEMSVAGMFTVACNPTIVGQRMYDIIDSRSGRYVHAQDGGLCVTWSAGNNNISASEWRFKPVSLTDDEVAAIKAKWEENKNMTQNTGKYQAILDEIFTDKACTAISSELTDERYAELVAQLPDLLADMCNKVKDNTWTAYPSGRNWEKAFRIASHGVVSNNGAMSRLVAVDYGFSLLSDPTGIHTAANEVVAIMVDTDIPAGASLMVECQNGFGMSGSQIALGKGLNLVAPDTEANLFICYMINSGADDPANYIAAYPDIKIHIEGGEVFGKVDRTRIFEVEKTTEVDGTSVTSTERYDMLSRHAWSDEAAAARNATDSLWVRMKADGLLANNYMAQVRSETILFNFTSSEFLAACPDKLGEVTDIWDWMMKSEQFIMGLRNNWTLPEQNGELIDTYIPNFSKRFNNCYMATERTGGYMNAIGYGAMYTVGTARSILNFENLKAGGAVWGPAHEHGHDHQQLINMIGMSEVSNNLFANVANYYHGTLVSRGNSLPDVINNYANGGHWFDLSIWNMTQMYYKLFLYYHAAHNQDDFYPLVFKKLRDGERIRRVQNTAVGAHEDYLRFALACAEVAGEDLSDFFEAYGMFRAISPEVSTGSGIEWVEKNGKQCRYVGDYGDFYIYTDMDKVAEMKTKIKACGPRNTTVLFAEDRVTREEATNPFSEPGDKKGDRGDGGVVGDYGNVGQYSDMDKADPDYDPDKTTGYVFYDEDGNMIGFTATEKDGDPVIPQSVVNNLPEGKTVDDIVVAGVEINGDVIEQADPDDEVFAITTYSYDSDGNRNEVTVYSAGRMQPYLKGNDVAVVSARDMSASAAARVIYSRDTVAAVRRLAARAAANTGDYKFKTQPNIIIRDDGGALSMNTLSVVDKSPLYLPEGDDGCGPLTGNVAYTRTNTAGWNSVCLPFAVTAADFGDDAKIFTLRSNDDESISLTEVGGVEAGEPCFVLCPDEVTQWTIDRECGDEATTVVAKKVKDDVQINGSFENKVIGAGKFKINATGTKFGRTGEAATVTAFRSYIEAAEGVNLNARSFILRIYDDVATGVQPAERVMEAGRMYDLNGQPIERPVPGKPYILNGKVRID